MKIADASFIPSNLEECFEALERMTSEEERRAFLARGRDKVFMLHHSTGRWIRNNWGLGAVGGIAPEDLVRGAGGHASRRHVGHDPARLLGPAAGGEGWVVPPRAR